MKSCWICIDKPILHRCINSIINSFYKNTHLSFCSFKDLAVLVSYWRGGKRLKEVSVWWHAKKGTFFGVFFIVIVANGRVVTGWVTDQNDHKILFTWEKWVRFGLTCSDFLTKTGKVIVHNYCLDSITICFISTIFFYFFILWIHDLGGLMHWK